ncbi:PQ-loop domain-containing transporter [Mesorhizobium sp. SB112]|uniref:SemiSWEET family sugar transporter n=1 Tax=Mesorhizobium sp. SB112 TaxID=3151853 RepID=UPI003262E44D
MSSLAFSSHWTWPCRRPVLAPKTQASLMRNVRVIVDIALIVGYLASLCSVTSFVPQAWKIVKTGETAAISARMYSVTVIGFSLWLLFGMMRVEWPIILTNMACFCFSLFILIMKMLPVSQREKISKKLYPKKL